MTEKDIAEKALEAFPDVFADIVNVLAFGGEEVIRPEELRQSKTAVNYWGERGLRGLERDQAMLWHQMNICLAFVGIENMTEISDDMPLRIIGYDGGSYRDQLYMEIGPDGKRRVNRNPRYPVVTLVLNFGAKRWTRPLSLYDILTIPEKLKPLVSDYRINVFDVAWLTDEQLAMFKSDFRVVAEYFVQRRKNEDYKPTEMKLQHVREVLNLLRALSKDSYFDTELFDWEKEEAPKMMSDFMKRTLDHAFAEEKRKFEQEMREQMEEEKKKVEEETTKKVEEAEKKVERMARQLHGMGLPEEQIIEVVGMDPSIVRSWLREDN